MRKIPFLGCLVVGLTIGSSAQAALKTYVATCNGAQVVPPQNNAATCSATLTLDDSARTVWGTITFSGITPTVGRIEQGGLCGSAASIAPFTLPAASGNTITIPEANPWSLSTLNFGYFIGGASDIALQQTSGPAIRGQIYEQGSGKSCGPDAGTGAPGDTDAGTSTPDGGSSSTPPPSGTTSSSGGAQPAPTSTATAESPAAESSDGGGCNTAANGPTSAVSLGLAALVLGGLVRRRRRA